MDFTEFLAESRTSHRTAISVPMPDISIVQIKNQLHMDELISEFID
jgi:hypothetical protein